MYWDKYIFIYIIYIYIIYILYIFIYSDLLYSSSCLDHTHKKISGRNWWGKAAVLFPKLLPSWTKNPRRNRIYSSHVIDRGNVDLTWSRFLSSFHKTGTSSNALAACTDHCGWRGGQDSISNCRDLLLMHWTRLLLSLLHRPHLHFLPLLSSSCSDCCSLSQALTFNHRKSVALSLAGKKNRSR